MTKSRSELRRYWRTRNREYRRSHREVIRKLEAKWYANAKAAAYVLLGGRCKWCGFSDVRALQIDHKKAIGDAKRRQQNERGVALYRRILKRPELYQLLCANCNWIKRVENAEH